MRTLVAAVAVMALTFSFGCGGGGGGGGGPVVDAPTASFTHSPESVAIGAPMNFTDASTAVAPESVDAWSWTFEGGSVPTATTQNVTGVSFTTSGWHNVTLTVTDSLGRVSAAYVHAVGVIVVGDLTKPNIDVTKVVLKGTVSDNVSVTTLTDKVGAAAAQPITGVTPTAAGVATPFTSNDITTTGAGTTNVTIHAADAAANTKDVNVVITETIVP